MLYLLFAAAALADPQHPDLASVDLSTTATEVNLERGNDGLRLAPRAVNAVGGTIELGGFAASLARDLPELNPGRANGSRAESYGASKSWDSFALDAGASRNTGVTYYSARGNGSGYKRDMHLEYASATASALLWSNGFALTDAYGLKPTRGKGIGVFAAVSVDYLNLSDPVAIQGDTTRIDARAATAFAGSGYTSKVLHDRLFVSTVVGYGIGIQQVADTTPSGRQLAGSRFAHKRFYREAIGLCAKQSFIGLLISADEPNFDMNGTAVKSSRNSFAFSLGTTF